MPRLIIKYEDLQLKPKSIVLKIRDFLNKIHKLKLNLNNHDIDQIIENTSFNNLKKLEDRSGFD